MTDVRRVVQEEVDFGPEPEVNEPEVQREADPEVPEAGGSELVPVSGSKGLSELRKEVLPALTDEMLPESPIMSQLPVKVQLAMLKLMEGGSNVEAAQAAGVDRKTVGEWRKNRMFREELARQCTLMQERHRARLTYLGGDALSVLEEMLYKEGDDRLRFQALKVALRACGLDEPRPSAKPEPIQPQAAPTFWSVWEDRLELENIGKEIAEAYSAERKALEAGKQEKDAE